jgi:uncharacterized protein
MNSGKAICIMAKNPKPGKVKNHLEPCCGNKQAALLAKSFLLDVMSTALRIPRSEQFIAYWPLDSKEEFEDIVFLFQKEERDLKIAGKASELRLIPQEGETPDKRLSHISNIIFQAGAEKAIFLSSDNPLLDPMILKASFELLKKNNVVIGPTFDGGFYILGVDRHYPILFQGLDWKPGRLYRQITEKLENIGLSWQELEISYDIDRPEELEQLYCDIENLRLAGKNDLCYHTERCLANMRVGE